MSRVPSGTILRIDGARGVVDGCALSAQSGFTLFYNFGEHVPPGRQFVFYFTPPPGTIATPEIFDPFSPEFSPEFGPHAQAAVLAGVVTETGNWFIGKVPLPASQGIFAPDHWIGYVTGPGEFNKQGVWQFQIGSVDGLWLTSPVSLSVGP